MSSTVPPSLPPRFHRLAWSNLAAQSAEQVGLAAAQTLPFLLLSFPAGVLADRTPRRRLMALAEAARMVALFALPVLALSGWLSVPLLATLGFAAATGTVAFSVAAPALVPALVPREALAAANGRLELARSIAFAGGPALAGALVGWAGTSSAFALAGALSGLAVLLLIGVPEPPRPALPPRHLLHDLREGARFACTHTLLRPILLTGIAWNVAWFVLQAAYVPYAVHRLGLTASGIGITLAAYGAGMVTGAALAPRITRRMSFGMSVAMGPLVSVLAAAAMVATILVPTPLLAGLSFFLFGAGPILWTISQTTLRQTVTPAAMLGRVSALFLMALTGARPLGAAIGAAVGAGHGPAACILLAAAGFLVQAGIILCSPVPRLLRLPAAA